MAVTETETEKLGQAQAIADLLPGLMITIRAMDMQVLKDSAEQIRSTSSVYETIGFINSTPEEYRNRTAHNAKTNTFLNRLIALKEVVDQMEVLGTPRN